MDEIIMPRKKYKLHCFRCGYAFNNKEEVRRVNGMPICEMCEGDYYSNEAEHEAYEYEMMEWRRSHPGVDYEQWQIDQANIRKYGEY